MQATIKRHHRSPAAEQYRRLYKTAAWRALRLAQLRSQPLCERCLADNVVEPATVVHHREAHKGDEKLFWDPKNLESVCDPCHSGPIQSEERRGFSTAIGPDGWPVDARHPAAALDAQVSRKRVRSEENPGGNPAKNDRPDRSVTTYVTFPF
jgi:5-methylcytosine-specific restriction protein A